jgi:hypothetical protein
MLSSSTPREFLAVNIFAIIIGSIVGLITGFFAGWLFYDFGWLPSGDTLVWKSVAGGACGGFAGGIAGSISGDLNRAGGGSNKFLLAFVCGAICGALGGSKLYFLGKMLDGFQIQHPFQNY